MSTGNRVLFPVPLLHEEKEKYRAYASVKGFSSLAAYLRCAANAVILMDEGKAINIEQAMIKSVMMERDQRKKGR
jgi:L-amino acid N-acyltransferase YncA